MKLTKNIGLLALGIYFVLHGIVSLTDLNFAGLRYVMGVIALIAGIGLLFFDRSTTS